MEATLLYHASPRGAIGDVDRSHGGVLTPQITRHSLLVTHLNIAVGQATERLQLCRVDDADA